MGCDPTKPSREWVSGGPHYSHHRSTGPARTPVRNRSREAAWQKNGLMSYLVCFWEVTRHEHVEEASLAAGAVADDDNLINNATISHSQSKQVSASFVQLK